MTSFAIIGNLGVPELILILVIVLIIFGAGKLPQIGDALGKGIRNFKRSSKNEDEVDVTPRKELPAERSSRGAVVDVEDTDDVLPGKRST